MNIEEILCINNYPSIDLHGIDSATARVMINDFVNEQYKLKNKYIVIIHGIGTGIIRNTTFDTLKNNKKVLEYHTVYNNTGSTIAKLDIKDS